MTTKPDRIVIERERNYEDASGPRMSVRYDSKYRLGTDPERYVQINGVGGEISVQTDGIAALIEWLREVSHVDATLHHVAPPSAPPTYPAAPAAPAWPQ